MRLYAERVTRHPLPLPAALTALDRTLVMGVVNVTPDSFSDGGRWFEPSAAVEHGRRLLAEGADVLDVGGESTRPGSGRVSVDEERRRVLPVIRELAAAGAVVSIDTTRAVVAQEAVAAGALVVNDVSGGLADPDMGRVVAETGVVYVAMHWRGHADVMDSLAQYGDVVADVRDELAQRLDALLAAGVDAQQVVLDPGLGFAKPGRDNWPLLAHLDVLVDGRYVAGDRLGDGLRGSANQQLHVLTRRHTLAEVEATPTAEVRIAPDGTLVLTGVDPLKPRQLT